jgi:hypothetical protein
MGDNGKSVLMELAQAAGLLAPRYLTFRIWYMLPATDLRLARQRRGTAGDDRGPLVIQQSKLQDTHRCVTLLPVPQDIAGDKTLGTIYNHFQAENWSPNGEAQPLIAGLGLGHTSMSIGDVIENFDAQTAWMVADFGFTRLPK